jgi:hypothetical protein
MSNAMKVWAIIKMDKKRFMEWVAYGWKVSIAKASRIMDASGYKEIKHYLSGVNPMFGVYSIDEHITGAHYLFKIKTISYPSAEERTFFSKESKR